jgi:hypothetical protein
MPIAVKTVAAAQQSMTEAAGTISARYTRGVTPADWKTGASSDNAEQLYDTKVQQAAANHTRQNAINKVSNDAWKNAALGKGAQRIGPGFTAGIDKWGTNTAPYLQAIAGVTLPARTADGMANLQNRAGAVVAALIAKKQSIQGTT